MLYQITFNILQNGQSVDKEIISGLIVAFNDFNITNRASIVGCILLASRRNFCDANVWEKIIDSTVYCYKLMPDAFFNILEACIRFQ